MQDSIKCVRGNRWSAWTQAPVYVLRQIKLSNGVGQLNTQCNYDSSILSYPSLPTLSLSTHLLNIVNDMDPVSRYTNPQLCHSDFSSVQVILIACFETAILCAGHLSVEAASHHSQSIPCQDHDWQT